MPAPNSRRRPAIIAALPLVLLALAAPVAAAETLTVAPTLVDDDKEVLATVESVRSPQARARIGGTVDTLKVAEGDRVKKGDLLAVVVDPKLKLQLASEIGRAHV